LEQTVLVDTPGLTSAVREHERALLRYLHKADLIVIVAPSNQPYTKEIEELLKLLEKRHSTQLAYVINIFEDPEVYLEDPEKLTRLKEFVRERLRNILSSEDVDRMKIFAFSVRAVRKSAEGGYDFLTREWESFKKFIFDDVIKRAKRIKQNALKEKILKTLSNSAELEGIRVKLERDRGELRRWEDLKEGVEDFLLTQKEAKKEKVENFV
jgi:GTPase Era involved in 16S rRNA processing